MPGSDSHILLSGPRWHKRRRTQPSGLPESSDSGGRSDGVAALGPQGGENDWRLHGRRSALLNLGTLSVPWNQLPGSRKGMDEYAQGGASTRLGNLGLATEDLAWHAGSGLPEPTLLARLPLLHFLALKLVHFFVDYHPDWVASLGLPPSDGTHRQLRREHFQPALQRLQNMLDADTPLQLFSAANISHKELRGV
jgi:hypothetical protein